ncbi:carcinoembryonic antigen-related cell adhesion molecule 1-like [Saccopteryx bilineata]|uniref:carcinoembryonic antigen-related cell adhesion molecule 1-like n=1 Tax=Saccopteryx bilineata TaxID=59482 RepID=UPI00338D6B37
MGRVCKSGPACSPTHEGKSETEEPAKACGPSTQASPAHRGKVEARKLAEACGLSTTSTHTAEGSMEGEQQRDVEAGPATTEAQCELSLTRWFRGEEVTYSSFIGSLAIIPQAHAKGPADTGREKFNRDGSLKIKKVTLKDAGYYTVVAFLPGKKKEIGFGRLNVYQPVRVPTLLASNTEVTENKDSVVLTCYTNALSTQWFFNGMSLQLTDRMKLSSDSRTLTIDPVKMEDAGSYQCEVSNPISTCESAPVELDVKEPVRKPTLLASNTTVMENEDTVVLTCYSNGLCTQWIFNGTSLWLTERMQLSPDNRILTIDPVRREDAGNYQCKVSNPVSSYESVPLKLDVIYE